MEKVRGLWRMLALGIEGSCEKEREGAMTPTTCCWGRRSGRGTCPLHEDDGTDVDDEFCE